MIIEYRINCIGVPYSQVSCIQVEMYRAVHFKRWLPAYRCTFNTGLTVKKCPLKHFWLYRGVHLIHVWLHRGVHLIHVWLYRGVHLIHVWLYRGVHLIAICRIEYTSSQFRSQNNQWPSGPRPTDNEKDHLNQIEAGPVGHHA